MRNCNSGRRPRVSSPRRTDVALAPDRLRGYALLAALILLVLVSLAVVVAVEGAGTAARRERETQLLFVGDQFRAAIASYRAIAPKGTPFAYPAKLDDLLEDKRFQAPVRHLRRVYPDPMTGQADWEIETLQGRIVGIHSRSTAAPLKRGAFLPVYGGFAGAHSYEDWRFEVASADKDPRVGDLAASTVAPPPAADPNEPPPEPVQPPDPTLEHRNQCFQSYNVPQGLCSDEPPPYGNDQFQCIMHYSQLYADCLNYNISP